MDDQETTTVAVKEFLNSKSTYISLKTKKQILEYIEKLEEETIDDLDRKLNDKNYESDKTNLPVVVYSKCNSCGHLTTNTEGRCWDCM